MHTHAQVAQNGFDWQNFHGASTPPKGEKCASFLRSACTAGSSIQSNAVQFGLKYKYKPDFSGGNLTQFNMDLGVFLASRGP